MMLDIDRFGQVNDTYGHVAGDAVLKALADIIRGQLREADIPARYGGEEFAMILPETTPPPPRTWPSACAARWPRRHLCYRTAARSVLPSASACRTIPNAPTVRSR